MVVVMLVENMVVVVLLLLLLLLLVVTILLLEVVKVVPVHCGSEQPKTQTEVLGHSLIHFYICSSHSLICLLRSTCFALALRCARLLGYSLLRSWDSV